ncbi:MAG: hypothetical protein IRZ16_11695 [Myxococcaceae bacterium]|nr:hypothetical protein [Myxococcaceae bacterium]
MRCAVLSASVFLVCALPGPDARAHDGPPEPLSLHERGDDGDGGRVMGTSFGLLQSVNGVAWDIICAEAIGYTEQYDPVVHWSAGGTLFVGSPKGLFISRDGGCNWSPHSFFTTRGASDVRGAPGQPNVVFATSSRIAAQNGLFRSDDDGFNWTTLAARADTQYTAIRFAPSNPMRAYASAWSLDDSAPLVYRSDDAGQSFVESTAIAPWFSGFTLVAVSPTDPEVLFASVYDGSEYVLLASNDAGATFAEVARDARAFRAMVFEPDTGIVWATANRLFRSSDGGKTFVKHVAPKRPACITRARGETELCGSSLDEFAIAVLELDGGITPTFRFDQSRGLLSCAPGSSVHDICTPIWGAIAALLGLPSEDGGMVTPDGGADGGPAGSDGGDAGASIAADGGPNEGKSPGGCGCAESGGPERVGWIAILGLRAAMRRSRRKRAKRAGRSNLSAGTAGVPRARGGATAAALVSILCGVVALVVACSPTPPPGPPDAGAADPCTPNPCGEAHRTVCTTDASGAPSCACDPGFHDVAGACIADSPCDPNPCIQPHKTVCSLVGSVAACGCDPGFVEDDHGDCVPSPDDCSAQHVTGDAFEPDECPTLARDIGGSGTQRESHTLDPQDDVDWFRVDVGKGRIIRVQAESSSSMPLRADAWMGSPLAPVGRAHGGSVGVDAAWRAPAAGTFYFRVAAGEPTSVPIPYTISLGDLGLDDTGDSVSEARAGSLGEPELGTLQFNGDVDVLSFMLEAGHTWRFEWSTSAPTPLLADWLDGAGTVIRSGATTGGTGELVTRTESTGDVFIALHADPEVAEMPWSVTVTDLGPDDHGDAPAEATAIAPGAPQQAGTLERDGDVDVFSFTAIAGHIYDFICTPVSVSDCLVTLVDPSGTLVAEDLDGLEGRVTTEVGVAGTWTVQVTAPPGQTGGYTYALFDLGVDDFGDDSMTAAALGMPPVGGTVSGVGNIETAGDRDYLQFEADIDHIYDITCTRNTLGACNMRVFDVNGLPVAQDTNGGDARTLHLYKGGGTYYVEISGAGTATGTYSWKIEDHQHDDHGDDLFAATPMLANGAWVNGEIQTFTDQDWLSFAAVADHAYRIVCQRVSLGDCLLTVEDAAENVLAQDTNGQDAEVVVKMLSSADDYLQISAPMGQLGTYWVKIEDLGQDDCPETQAGAPAMFVNGIAANGVFEYPGDIDVREASLVANTVYHLTATGVPLRFTVYASDGVTVIASGAPPASFSDPVAGPHYLEVRALSPMATGAYSIAVSP